MADRRRLVGLPVIVCASIHAKSGTFRGFCDRLLSIRILLQ